MGRLSGNLLHSYGKWPSRNSEFVFPFKDGRFSIAMLNYQRVVDKCTCLWTHGSFTQPIIIHRSYVSTTVDDLFGEFTIQYCGEYKSPIEEFL